MCPDHGDAELTDLETAEIERIEAPRPETVRTRGARAREARARRSTKQRSILIRVGAVCAAVLGLYGVSEIPAVSTLLRQSFTQLPTPYTDMYFSGTPVVDGILLTVPVTVVDHATTADSFVLKVWMTNAAGAKESATSLTVTPKHGQATTVVKVSAQLPADAQVVWISLAGQTQTLHYRIAGVGIPTPTTTPTPTASASAKSTAKTEG